MVFPQCQYVFVGWMYEAWFVEAACYFPAPGTRLCGSTGYAVPGQLPVRFLCGSTRIAHEKCQEG
jgi:hypothetical protein